MCGIAGILYFRELSHEKKTNDEKVLRLLKHRGPDSQGSKTMPNCTLYHCRLQIIDTSEASNQPFSENTESLQTLVYNGEIFNYKELGKSFSLKTSGDVEVLFKLLQSEGSSCLNKLNGFFSFAFYDQEKNTMLLARDRFGVKPLYYFYDEEKFAFASELKPLMEIVGKQPLNYEQVYSYFRLNYTAGRESIFKNVYKLLPGELIEIKGAGVSPTTWYKAPLLEPTANFEELMDDAVKIRLQADVPVGTFLSGGLDSSIISALAIRHKPQLSTFSIGFDKNEFFDETRYSQMVADHIGSRHHVFRLKEDDFISYIGGFLNVMDEPFADSSAFNFYMLSRFTSDHVKVALSGDGADELFKGYNKHRALLLSDNTATQVLGRFLSTMLNKNSGSRDGAVNNKVRQIKRFAQLARLPDAEKLKFLASVSTNAECMTLLKHSVPSFYFDSLFTLSERMSNFSLQDASDLQVVLPDDMLVKADRFSMRHGIEIRTPFLDYRIAEYALNLPQRLKINRRHQKIILKKTFAHLLPHDIIPRGKKGFELPLQSWLSKNLRSRIDNEWLHPEKLAAEGILDPVKVRKICTQVYSDDPGDSPAQLWAVIVFEHWLDNFKEYVAPDKL